MAAPKPQTPSKGNRVLLNPEIKQVLGYTGLGSILLFVGLIGVGYVSSLVKDVQVGASPIPPKPQPVLITPDAFVIADSPKVLPQEQGNIYLEFGQQLIKDLNPLNTPRPANPPFHPRQPGGVPVSQSNNPSTVGESDQTFAEAVNNCGLGLLTGCGNQGQQSPQMANNDNFSGAVENVQPAITNQCAFIYDGQTGCINVDEASVATPVIQFTFTDVYGVVHHCYAMGGAAEYNQVIGPYILGPREEAPYSGPYPTCND